MKLEKKSLLAVLLAFAMVFSIVPIKADGDSAAETGSLTIKLRQTAEDVTTDQELSKTVTPTKGTIGYKLLLVAKFDENKGYFVGEDGEEYTRINLDGLDVDTVTPIETVTEKKNTEDAGEIKFEGLKSGRYIAVQTLKNDGTAKYNHFMVDIPGYTKKEDGSLDNEHFVKDVLVYPKNTLPLKSIIIKKVDGDTNKFVAGAKVTIKKTTGTLAESDNLKQIGEDWYVVNAEGEKELTVTEDGLKIVGLTAGTYFIEETVAPDGYKVVGQELMFKILTPDELASGEGGASNADNEIYKLLLPYKETYVAKVDGDKNSNEFTITIKNYKTPKVEKILDPEENQNNNAGDTYFDPAKDSIVKWDVNVTIPMNIRNYTKLEIKDTPQKGMKFKSVESVKFGDVTLEADTDYTVEDSTVKLTIPGLKKLKEIVEGDAYTPGTKLVAKFVVEFDKDNFDWDVLKHENTATITHKYQEEKDETDEHKPEEKMVTGTLSVVKKLEGTKVEGSKPSDVQFKVYRKITDSEGTTETQYMTLEKRDDGIWYPTGTAEKDAATVISPDGDEDEYTSKPIKVYGLLVSDTTLDLEKAEYFLEEVKAPNGYRPISKAIDSSVTTDRLRAELTVKNSQGPTLPITGGIGTMIGLILILGLGVWAVIWSRNRKTEPVA